MQVITHTEKGDLVVDGKLKRHREENKSAISTDLKGQLDKLWNVHMTCYFDNSKTKTENMGTDFVESKDNMKEDYDRYAVQKYGSKEECVEIEGAYNVWYNDRDIANLIKNFANIGKQMEEKLRKEQEYKEEIDRITQINKEKEKVEKIEEETEEVVEENVKKIEERHETTKKEVGFFESIGNAIVEAATAVVDTVASAGKSVWNFITPKSWNI